ncbi:MAG: orotidine-5-phosphate decarboxylase [Bacteroidota bacterium]|jgi:orotidine-5'-phosphate decarboxylase
MNRAQLIANIRERESFLCVGLDTDPNKLPAGVTMLAFNKAIIDATRDLCVAYKPNVAFYECLGPEGWRVLEETVRYIGPDHFIIADAKRGDIGNTSDYYAKTFFSSMPCDSVTVAPYMGRDSVEPFLKYADKWAIVLALTSNPGADDFELLSQDGIPLYQQVLQKVSQWGTPDNTMFVVGATRPTMLTEIRAIVPDHFLLVPGVGAQGGSLTEVCKYGMNKDIGLLINASRSILYASSGHDFEVAARKEAKRMQEEMKSLLR